jgi:hypothetical protein
LYPVTICLGKPDTPFKCFELRSLHLVLLYHSKWYLCLRNMVFMLTHGDEPIWV